MAIVRGDGTVSEPEEDGALGTDSPESQEEDVPAPVWARLLLTAAPFVVAALVFLVLRHLAG